MPLIQISQAPGLTDEQKRDVVASVTAAYAEASGKNPGSVWVALTDLPRESRGVGGARSARSGADASRRSHELS